jgi:quinoprotein glucose dehydrogenase
MQLGPRRPTALLLLGWFASVAAAPSAAQPGAVNGEWRHYGGDLGSTKYSSLAQVDAGNFDDLAIVWRWSSVDAWMSRAVAKIRRATAIGGTVARLVSTPVARGRPADGED